MSESTEIQCPSCGASLGASQESGEYTCGHCGHVSHQGRLRPVYGAGPEIQAYIQKESEAAMREYAEREGRAARPAVVDPPPSVAIEKSGGATSRVVIVLLIVLVVLGAAVYALSRP